MHHACRRAPARPESPQFPPNTKVTVILVSTSIGSPAAFRRYERHVLDHLASWRRAVGYFYDGRLFTLIKVGQEARKTWFGALLDPHFNTHFPRVFTGERIWHVALPTLLAASSFLVAAPGQSRIFDNAGIRRSVMAINQGHLAEEIALGKIRKRHLFAVFILYADVHATAFDQKHGVARITFVK